MNQKYYLTIALFCALICASCSNKDEKEIEKEQSSGVVLVQNKSYYEVKLSNGESLFFSDFSDDEIHDLAFSEDSVKVSSSFGTGFFVDDKGTIATNAHVVSSTANEKEINRSIGKVIDMLKRMTEIAYNQKMEEYNQIDYLYNYANYSPDVSYSDFYALRDQRNAIESELNEMKSTYNGLNQIRPSDSEIIYHNEVSVAYNETHITKSSDFADCVFIGKDSNHDLALIQLKAKATPTGRYIFRVADKDPMEEYSLADKITSKIKADKNNKLFMHGFNLGPALALTNEGLKAQFTNGTVSQTTADRLMYTIPALPGSSGSPVVNRKGELVAINYAGLNGTQGFNYGVRVKHLRQLLANPTIAD